MSRDIITDILNRVQALVEAEIVTYKQVAQGAKLNRRTLEGWFGEKRRNRPSGNAAFALQEWLGKKTLAVAALPNAVRCAYRRAFNEVSKKFPVNGSN